MFYWELDYTGQNQRFRLEVLTVSRELTILLVEDDAQVCEEIVRYVDELEDVSLVGVTGHVDQAIQITKECAPDAMILDLELHVGSGNGLALLQSLRQLSLPRVPYILVATNNSSSITYALARQLGADFILSKHQADYSPKGSVDFLRMMQPVLLRGSGQAGTGDSPNLESPERRNKRMRRRICAQLDQIGISPKAVGYRYLADSIQRILQEPEPNFCRAIGEQYGRTESSVERAMQNAIARAWRTTPIDDLLRLYTARVNSEKGMPTLTEFVYYYANKLKNET